MTLSYIEIPQFTYIQIRCSIQLQYQRENNIHLGLVVEYIKFQIHHIEYYFIDI